MSWEDENIIRDHIVENPFAGEDEDSAIPDSWDAEEEVVKVQPEPIVKKPELPKSKLLKKELKEKEMKKQLDEKVPLTERDRENFDKSLEYELFKDALEIKTKVVGIDDFQVKTKDDFEKLRELLKKKLLPLETNTNYSSFLENTFRDLVVSSDSDSLKKLSLMFNTMANEKSKVQKTTGKKKKGVKGAKLATVRANDVTNYEDDDDLDFDEEF